MTLWHVLVMVAFVAPVSSSTAILVSHPSPAAWAMEAVVLAVFPYATYRLVRLEDRTMRRLHEEDRLTERVAALAYGALFVWLLSGVVAPPLIHVLMRRLLG